MVQTLSDGERQKMMIAKALAQQTPIIYLDEPTAFLDYPSKADMMQLLHRLAHQTSKTIFLSTHDLELALQVADRLWLMQPGHPLSVGTARSLALDGSLSAFLDRPGLHFDPQTLAIHVVSA
jgi:iron complex transport system ATP-binding protein